MCRQKTGDEIRAEFLDHIRVMVGYWAGLEGKTSRERLDGLAFAILEAIDGVAGGLTGAFHLIPTCHEDDPGYLSEEGSDWWPLNEAAIEAAEAMPTQGVMLHEEWHK